MIRFWMKSERKSIVRFMYVRLLCGEVPPRFPETSRPKEEHKRRTRRSISPGDSYRRLRKGLADARLESVTSTLDEVSDSDARSKDEEEWNKGHGKTEHFVPIATTKLTSKLAQELILYDGYSNPKNQIMMQEFSQMAQTVLHHRFHFLLEDLKMLYMNLDPDTTDIDGGHEYAGKVMPRPFISTSSRKDQEFAFIRNLSTVMRLANYHNLNDDYVREALQEHETDERLNVRVPLESFTLLKIWVRGETPGVQRNRDYLYLSNWIWLFFDGRWKIWNNWLNLIKPRGFFSQYVRTLVAVRRKDDPYVYLKLFKDVRTDKLELLLPNTRLNMSMRDKVILSAIVVALAAAAAVRTVTIAASVDAVHHSALAGAISMFVTMQAWQSYKNRKNRYVLDLSRFLFYKLLANNKGVLTLLSDRAENQETNEVLLTYYFLLVDSDNGGSNTEKQLANRIEMWLKSRYNVNIKFHVQDGIRKLEELTLLRRLPPEEGSNDDKLVVQPLPIACDRLRMFIWDHVSKRWYNNTVDCQSNSFTENEVHERTD